MNDLELTTRLLSETIRVSYVLYAFKEINKKNICFKSIDFIEHTWLIYLKTMDILYLNNSSESLFKNKST